jgi:hypothetical protein
MDSFVVLEQKMANQDVQEMGQIPLGRLVKGWGLWGCVLAGIVVASHQRLRDREPK